MTATTSYPCPFDFHPKQRVTITDGGLNYEGIVIRCIWERGDQMYDVEFIADGQFYRREFYATQLKEKESDF